MHSLEALGIVSVVRVCLQVWDPCLLKAFLLTRPFQSVDPCDCHIDGGKPTFE